jgi:anti-sigma regulatory factor (Ser/Thr protein kinase)
MSLPADSARFPADAAQLGAVLAYAEGRCEALGLGHDVGLRVVLIVEELFVNTVSYGDCAGQAVELALALQGDELALRYEDPGVAFDPFSRLADGEPEKPLEQRRVGGLGVVLIDGFCSRRHYARIDGRNRIDLWLPTAPADD